ncbi:hypothetical protein A2U01_0063291, partial [Trifolium medium]|nr:hypothetical protein [Trifolium medium]
MSSIFSQLNLTMSSIFSLAQPNHELHSCRLGSTSSRAPPPHVPPPCDLHGRVTWATRVPFPRDLHER